MKLLVTFFLVIAPLAAQMPPEWNHRTALGSDSPAKGWWYGAGLWAGDHTGPTVTLTDSLGLGNALTGTGFHLEGGYRNGPWDLAMQVLGDRTPQGQEFATLYRSHVWYRGRSGWQGGFEQEPLVWGYGLNGGYVLGEAARPFPRLRVESPMAELNAGPVPLGQWGFQAFMGRLENHRVLSGDIQDPSWRSRAIVSQGDVEAPLLMGYRAQAKFGPWLEFYMNMTNMWSGTLNGRGMTQGYGLSEYLTAMTGLKDTLAEANTDFSDPGHPTGATYKNGARSASEADVGFRAQLPFLARPLSAQKVQFYISRGSKTMIWPVGLLVKRPVYYMAKDAQSDAQDVVNPGAIFNKQSRYLLPTLAFPNNTVGLLVAWTKIRAALEYFDGTNPATSAARTFTHGQYLTGFYYQGDPLGNAVGGEAATFTAKLEADFTPRLSGSTTLMRGSRPFRDNLPDWQLDHPGQNPGTNAFTGLQQSLAWKAGDITTLSLEAAWQRQTAVNYVAGNEANGFAWTTDVTFRWPARR